MSPDPTNPIGYLLSIDPNGVYRSFALTQALGLTGEVINAEIDSGRLRLARVGKSRLILGKWILEWLESMSSMYAKISARAPRVNPAEIPSLTVDRPTT
jgi:hypothetical protein